MTERFDHVVVGLGALGSAAAYHLARRGRRVLGLERFELGHHRGASHDASRILRHSYHTPEYVRLTQAAYDDWARLSADAGRELVTVVGGLDLFPPEPAIPMADYTASLAEVGVPFELLDVAAIGARWPQFSLPAGTVGLYQERGAIVPAWLGTATMQDLARAHGAVLHDRAHVASVTGSSVTLVDGTTYACESVVVCADAWTARLLAPLGLDLPLTVTLEQATYFAPERPEDFAPGRMPLWIWMDDPSFYGFPCYGEPTIKAAQDCGGPAVDPDARGSEVSEEMLALLAGHVGRMLPGSGRPVRSLRCQYTLTPDRDFVVDRVPGYPSVAVGLGAGHGFKFAPTFGRLLADLATGARESVSPTFALDRPALTDPAYSAHWLV
ncbi:N-methyl-L-tryptophan oxidase [Nocardioides aquiterrae]|uniref:N-methyl-L-tryptophan oxidase n=1 Tax=Nocardioides aquiterrae TaxID=203799 RepID=A0ABP4F3C1_9ACTN